MSDAYHAFLMFDKLDAAAFLALALLIWFLVQEARR